MAEKGGITASRMSQCPLIQCHAATTVPQGHGGACRIHSVDVLSGGMDIHWGAGKKGSLGLQRAGQRLLRSCLSSSQTTGELVKGGE